MAETYKTITNVPGWVDLLTSDGVPDSVATLYKYVPLLFRAVQLRCDALSSVPVAIMKGKENEVDWPYPTKLGNLIWQWEASNLLAGAAYGEIVTNKSGFRKDIKYRNPFDMNVKYDRGVYQFKQNSSGAVWYNEPEAGQYQMLYIKEFDPTQDTGPGIGAGKASNIDAKLLYAISKFPEMYFEGGAMPVTLLGIDSNDRNEIERIQSWFRRSATAIKNAFRVLGVRAGSITPVTLTPPLKDLSFPEISEMAKDNIAMAFGIKQTLLDSEAANYATAQEDRLSFYEDTIKPRARIFEDALNEQLLARDGLRLEFRFGEMDIFQEDESERADLLNNLTTAGLPIEVSLQLAGYKLTEEQLSMLEEHQEQLDSRIDEQPFDERTAELRKWQKFAEKRVKEGKELREFETSIIEPSLQGAINGALEGAKTAEEVKHIFDSVIEWRNYP
ncbi:MAG: phage portal protein [Candidatus Omnitrophica bacterium]|nr:phage portal protein [Candidatus Omnitrophota bacterium]